MADRPSLLTLSSLDIAPNLQIRIPTVGEILNNEQQYYNIVSSITTEPSQYMVQLDDMGIDYTKITDYELFMMLFPILAQGDLSIIFNDLDTSGFRVYPDEQNNTHLIYNPNNKIIINEDVYLTLSSALRDINLLKKSNLKPGNEAARKYLIEKERRKLKRNSKKPYESYLEKLVVALVNTTEFPYDYNNCMDLSIYRFNQSFKQIQHKINFDNIMIGVYAGTVDTSKLDDKDCLSWIQNG